VISKRRFSALLATATAVLLLCMSPVSLSAAAPDPVIQQLQADVVALRNRIAQLESVRAPVNGSAATVPSTDIAQRVELLRQQMAALATVFTVNSAGLAIKAPSISLVAERSMALQAADRIEIHTVSASAGLVQGLDMDSRRGMEQVNLLGSKDINLGATSDLLVQATNQINVKALTLSSNATSTTISSASNTTVNGAMVLINGGGTPILTLGSPRGSPTVLAP